MRNIPALYPLYLLFLLAVVPAVHARNIDLSTVPPRATAQLTIYNSEDLTLVRETRTVSFKQGGNPLQFSWANTLIDPTSVELKFLDHQAELDVLDTTFPHDKPQMLYWNVNSEYEGDVSIEISYFTSGISWQADYTAISNAAEDTLSLESFVRVINHSGEDYQDAQVRLVVGKINLVERIAQLAQAAGRKEGELGAEERESLRHRAAKQAMEMPAPAAPRVMGGARAMHDAMTEQPKEVTKEGLGEYFIYTIEGTETLPDGWSKRLRSFEAHAVPLKVQYRYRPQEYGDQLVRLYLLKNDQDSKLGTTPLPDGAIRIFRDNGRDGLSYLAEQTLQYIPIGDKIELNLGQDPEVNFELIKLEVARDDILLRLHGAEVYRKLGGGMQIESDSTVVGWNEHEIYTQRVRNDGKKPIELEIRRAYDGDVVFKSELTPFLHDYRTVQFSATVLPGEKQDLYHEVLTRQGKNAKKNNVQLMAGKAGE